MNNPDWLLPFSSSLSNPLHYHLFFPPVPQPKIAQFCLEDADNPANNSCRNQSASFQVIPGATKNLSLNWKLENADKLEVKLIPRNLPFDPTKNTIAFPAPAAPITYSLSILNDTGQEIANKSIGVQIASVTYTITAPALNLRKSPGIDYEQVNPTDHPLLMGTELILLTRPIDYAQNNDSFEWVKVRVLKTNEEGWLVFRDPISKATFLNPVATPSTTQTEGTSQSNNLQNPGSAQPDNTQNPGAAQPGNPQSAPNAPDASSGRAPDAAGQPVDSLPVEKPEFSATLTPTPTLTPMPTATPSPTATPLPTPHVDIQLSQTEIEPKTCVQVHWTITGVKAVYFDFGKGDLQPSNDNIDRTVELCNLTHNTDFNWRIVFNDNDAQDDNNIERNEQRRLIVRVKATPTPFTIIIAATPTWTPVGPTPPVQN
ncbi:MAG: hypothetical protein NT075_08350 [Chloroflexi bacterium]|nr:hypothetical protein [Chloroflexota bacterium]